MTMRQQHVCACVEVEKVGRLEWTLFTAFVRRVCLFEVLFFRIRGMNEAVEEVREAMRTREFLEASVLWG